MSKQNLPSQQQYQERPTRTCTNTAPIQAPHHVTSSTQPTNQTQLESAFDYPKHHRPTSKAHLIHKPSIAHNSLPTMFFPTAHKFTTVVGDSGAGRTPLRVYGPQPTYKTYVSPYGPKTKHTPNLMGLNPTNAIRYGTILAGFGISAGIFAIFFFGEVPKVRKDILQKVPVIGDYFVREIPPEDNPF